MTFPLRSDMGPPPVIFGATYLFPNRPLNPLYPPGSSGSTSGRPLFADEHRAAPFAQCTAIPTKSANACPGSDLTSAASGEVAPNTFGTSGPMFSSTVFAVATPPQLQPARVNGTHGAGALRPLFVTML